ncbi:Isotrichodermin C-15 hydroxylase [Diplogelasinospora grovesii]|uniref:Isotrichodermin C-15 hydroxylase n=1 Tax=Diplogelasinospora grovesii TaxID=303347 RepID=A0AAN6N557_9PEZI|nr:Isotrichodermin C-15 hydroxylase [Diplogelasinospora grovesii]
MALLGLSIGSIALLAITTVLVYVGGYVVYNLLLHPLAGYPGPMLMRATRATFCYHHMRGTLPFYMLELHKKYGRVVRIAPNELAFADPQAWKDIMGHRTTPGEEMEKWDQFYRPIKDIPTDIVNASRDEHALLRRTLAHGFSDRSMREQQPIIKGYIDLLIRKLRENCENGKKTVNMAAWYNYTTFDVIGDLAFGESFGCLDNSDYHPWVRAIFQLARAGTIFQTATHWPILLKLLLALAPKRAMEERQHHIELTKAKLRKRMESGKERPDLVEGLLKKKDEWGLTLDQLQVNSSILIIGGSETTATLLSGVTFFLLTSPETMRKLTEEIRGTFKREEEIDFQSVSQLPYLLACLDEALRMYPPVPIGLPRVVPRGGASICDHYVPEKTIVSIYQWALYHNETHFRDPFTYHPERWLGDEQFAGDHRDAFQPFHIGARNCLGRNLAYIEMRLILARVLWNFDMRIADGSRDWLSKQRIFNLWEKGPLNVSLMPVRET